MFHYAQVFTGLSSTGKLVFLLSIQGQYDYMQRTSPRKVSQQQPTASVETSSGLSVKFQLPQTAQTAPPAQNTRLCAYHLTQPRFISAALLLQLVRPPSPLYPEYPLTSLSTSPSPPLPTVLRLQDILPASPVASPPQHLWVWPFCHIT